MVALTKVYRLKFPARSIVIIDHFKKVIHSNSVSKLLYVFCWLNSLTFLISQLRSDPFLVKTWEQPYRFSQVKGEEQGKCIKAPFSWYFSHLWFGSLRRNHLQLTMSFFLSFFSFSVNLSRLHLNSKTFSVYSIQQQYLTA